METSYIKEINPKTKIIGVEPFGAPSMTEAFNAGKVVTLDKINTFVDEPDYKEECIIFGTGGNSNVKISNLFSCSTDNFIVKVNDPNILNKYIIILNF